MTNVIISYDSTVPTMAVEEYSLPSGSVVKRNGDLIDYYLMDLELWDGDEMTLTFVFKSNMKQFHKRSVIYRGIGLVDGVKSFKYDDAEPKKKRTKSD